MLLKMSSLVVKTVESKVSSSGSHHPMMVGEQQRTKLEREEQNEYYAWEVCAAVVNQTKPQKEVLCEAKRKLFLYVKCDEKS